MPGVVPRNKFHGLYPGLTLSRHALILETSLSKPAGSRLSRPAVTASLMDRERGQSNRLRPNLPFSRLGTQRSEQGSNISSGCPGATRGYKQIDQGRSLSCVHHKDV